MAGDSSSVAVKVFELSRSSSGGVQLSRLSSHSATLDCSAAALPAVAIQLVAYHDVYNDGMADVIAACALPSSSSGSDLDWYYLDVTAENITALPFVYEPEGSGKGTTPLTGMAVIGDVDGDGLNDLALAAAGAAIDIVLLKHSNARQEHGSPMAISALYATDGSHSVVDDSTKPLYTGDDIQMPSDITSIAAAGDTNGDGLPDFLVGIDSRLYLLRLEPISLNPSLPFTKPFNVTNIGGIQLYVTHLAGTLELNAQGTSDLHLIKWLRYASGAPDRIPGGIRAVLQLQSIASGGCRDVVTYDVTITPPDTDLPVALPSNCLQESTRHRECCRGPTAALDSQRHVHSVAMFGGLECGPTLIAGACSQGATCSRTYCPLPCGCIGVQLNALPLCLLFPCVLPHPSALCRPHWLLRFITAAAKPVRRGGVPARHGFRDLHCCDRAHWRR